MMATLPEWKYAGGCEALHKALGLEYKSENCCGSCYSDIDYYGELTCVVTIGHDEYDVCCSCATRLSDAAAQKEQEATT